MTLTRITACFGFLIVLTGVTAISQDTEKPTLPPDAKWVGIPKGGAGMIDIEDYIVVYDQGRGKGTMISKNEMVGDANEPKRFDFTIR